MTVANPGDEEEGPQEVELLELVDEDEPQDLGGGITVDARVQVPRGRRRRDSTIPPPRRWPRAGYHELRSCVICHLVCANVKEAFWHLQAEHGGETPDDVDAEEWIDDAAAELEELRAMIRSGKVRKWSQSGPDHGFSGAHMAAALIAVVVFMFLFSLIWIVTHLH